MIREMIKKSPDFIKAPVYKLYNSIPDNIKYGSVFNETYKFLQESQWWSREKLEEYQMYEISRLLNHAYENVPYYRRVFDERGLKPKDIQNFNDLKMLPYLTKEIVQNNLKDMIAQNYNFKDLYYITTGGSTGIPMGIYIDKKFANAREWAFISTLWARVGYEINKKNKCVILRGSIPQGGLYEYNGKDLILSSYKLTEDNMNNYIDMIRSFEPDFIQAYPSSIDILSDYILQNGIKLNLHNLKAILCSSENLYDFQRAKIRDAFNVRVYGFYGHTEISCLAGECEENSFYHIFPEYGYTELINEEGDNITEEDATGEIIATGFNNYVVPFIRYRTMDIAVNTNEKCTCGRNYKLIKKIEGRKKDLLLTSKGYCIIADMVIGSTHNDIFDNVSQFQFYQDTPGICTFNIVKKVSYSYKDEKYIYDELKKKLGNDMELEIKCVDSIPRTKSGKYRFLIQKLEI